MREKHRDESALRRRLQQGDPAAGRELSPLAAQAMRRRMLQEADERLRRRAPAALSWRRWGTAAAAVAALVLAVAVWRLMPPAASGPSPAGEPVAESTSGTASEATPRPAGRAEPSAAPDGSPRPTADRGAGSPEPESVAPQADLQTVPPAAPPAAAGSSAAGPPAALATAGRAAPGPASSRAAGGSSAQSAAAGSGEAAAPPPAGDHGGEHRRREVRFAAAGGTRVIWILDSDLDLSETS